MNAPREKARRADRRIPTVLSVAGSDSGAGAGIQADLLTFAANNAFGTTAITCLTAQSPSGVSEVHAAPVDFVRAQIETICAYFAIRAAKTGMLYSAAIVEVVAEFFRRHPRISLIVDPVMVSTSGASLLRADAVDAMTKLLFPRADLITPNLDEAAVLLGNRPANCTELAHATAELARRYGTAVLLKGGHLPGDRLSDVVALPNGQVRTFGGRRIHGVDTHGSGCTLSAAITAHLAHGLSIVESVVAARRYLKHGMRHPIALGRRRFIAH